MCTHRVRLGECMQAMLIWPLLSLSFFVVVAAAAAAHISATDGINLSIDLEHER